MLKFLLTLLFEKSRHKIQLFLQTYYLNIPKSPSLNFSTIAGKLNATEKNPLKIKLLSRSIELFIVFFF